jgi:hypothetical protein
VSEQPLHEAMNSVGSAEELAAFILRLCHDFTAHKEEWRNISVPACLESMAAWLRDTGEYRRQTQGESLSSLPPFQLCANVLYAAKVYE